ncbi:O-antigen ligase family protein [Sphingobacterium rhinopitheci]|uniref:O-antigen ligase family protein n=1 Tax=Sphingobacterium rhinopitheci TaxID=2781960 RepID=UPI001F52974E|nr:O-antigen ligase family protein [Sphingobacterium rhinopitheci]MCI0920538.1 O-antigen ligase family protein [Sphingobacterium rhinopitheci]
MDNKELLKKTGLVVLLAGLALLSLILSISKGVGIGFLLYSVPLLIVFFIICLQSPFITFLVLYLASFVVLGAVRYSDLLVPPGLIIDILLLFNFVVILLQHLWGNTKIGPLYFTPVLLLSFGWMGYCLIQVINPMATFSNWTTSVRNIGVHIVAFQILVFFVLNDLKRINKFFIFWGVLVILATIKAFGQKLFGFDAAEMAWLDAGSGRTHIIHSGIRYFSFYTDAANYGCNMGLSMVMFTILAVNEKSLAKRIFFVFVILFSIYGFLISGTRAAMAVPFIGFAVWVVLVKEWRLIISGFVILAFAFTFFNFTTIGNSNSDIRRMRTAFNLTEDASFNVRLINQQKMRSFMQYYPFGIGMGSAKNAQDGNLIYGIATDSSLVFVWVETGIVGLIFYLLIFFVVLGYGVYYIWFVLKSPEVLSITASCTAGLAGILVAGYANEVLHQMPTGQTVYILIGLIMISPHLDKKVLNA